MTSIPLQDMSQNISINNPARRVPSTDAPPEEYSKAERNETYEGCIRGCGNCCGCFRTWVCCCLQSPYQQIQESHYGVIKEFGKYKTTLPSGLHYVNPFTEDLIKVDRREMVCDLRRQNIMTKDNVYVTIDAVLYYHIEDPCKALFSVQDYQFAIVELAKTTLRDVFGHTMLQEALETKEKIALHIKDIVDEPSKSWGITITRVLIQEIIFSNDLQANLSAAATAKRLAEGKIIAAQADVDSAKLLREASDILNTPAAMQMRFLDAITGLAKGGNTKVIFMPGDSR